MAAPNKSKNHTKISLHYLVLQKTKSHFGLSKFEITNVQITKGSDNRDSDNRDSIVFSSTLLSKTSVKVNFNKLQDKDTCLSHYSMF